jgi:hypothetical protein
LFLDVSAGEREPVQVPVFATRGIGLPTGNLDHRTRSGEQRHQFPVQAFDALPTHDVRLRTNSKTATSRSAESTNGLPRGSPRQRTRMPDNDGEAAIVPMRYPHAFRRKELDPIEV